jgi:hypothetical protein
MGAVMWEHDPPERSFYVEHYRAFDFDRRQEVDKWLEEQRPKNDRIGENPCVYALDFIEGGVWIYQYRRNAEGHFFLLDHATSLIATEIVFHPLKEPPEWFTRWLMQRRVA